jgi:nicotinamidase-related amidase
MKIKSLQKENAILVVVDIQTRLLPAVPESEAVTEAAVKLIQGCRILGVNPLVTQQYTKGLGPTAAPVVSAVMEELDGADLPFVFAPVEKISFSAMGEDEFVRRLSESGRRSVILCGIEAHVCVAQTALDLLANNYEVFVISDAVASRRESDRDAALRRMIAAGAVELTYEAALFELLKSAGEPEFKQISRLVK